MPDGKSKLDPTTLPFVPDITNASSEYDELKSPISLVHEVALKRNLQVHFEVGISFFPQVYVIRYVTPEKSILGDSRDRTSSHENLHHQVSGRRLYHRGGGQWEKSKK